MCAKWMMSQHPEKGAQTMLRDTDPQNGGDTTHPGTLSTKKNGPTGKEGKHGSEIKRGKEPIKIPLITPWGFYPALCNKRKTRAQFCQPMGKTNWKSPKPNKWFTEENVFKRKREKVFSRRIQANFSRQRIKLKMLNPKNFQN